MTRYWRRQLNESGRGAAVTVANLGTNRLSRHPECRFCLYPLSVVVPGSVLHWNSARERWYICRLGDRHHCQTKVIWEMSAGRCPGRVVQDSPAQTAAGERGPGPGRQHPPAARPVRPACRRIRLGQAARSHYTCRLFDGVGVHDTPYLKGRTWQSRMPRPFRS